MIIRRRGSAETERGAKETRKFELQSVSVGRSVRGGLEKEPPVLDGLKRGFVANWKKIVLESG